MFFLKGSSVQIALSTCCPPSENIHETLVYKFCMPLYLHVHVHTSKSAKLINIGKSQEINQLTILHCNGLQYPLISEQQEITSTYEDPR